MEKKIIGKFSLRIVFNLVCSKLWMLFDTWVNINFTQGVRSIPVLFFNRGKVEVASFASVI